MAKTAICAICASDEYTCCQKARDTAGPSFPLSIAEKEKISYYLQGKSIQFSVKAPNSERLTLFLNNLFPNDVERIQTLYPEHGYHEQLLIDNEGHCVFLGPTGCTLIRKVRPFYCKLFPFWVSNNRLSFFHLDYCQAQKGVGSIYKVMARLDMDYFQIVYLYNALRKAWGIEE
jgi:Fe-S-cluster containining protein